MIVLLKSKPETKGNKRRILSQCLIVWTPLYPTVSTRFNYNWFSSCNIFELRKVRNTLTIQLDWNCVDLSYFSSKGKKKWSRKEIVFIKSSFKSTANQFLGNKQKEFRKQWWNNLFWVHFPFARLTPSCERCCLKLSNGSLESFRKSSKKKQATSRKEEKTRVEKNAKSIDPLFFPPTDEC